MSEAFNLPKLSQIGIRPGIVALALIALALPMARHVGPLPASLDRLVAADNLTTFVVYSIGASVQVVRVWGGIDWPWEERRLVVSGWGLILASWALHRLFWVPWRVWHELGFEGLYTWWKADMAWLTTPLQVGAWTGVVLVMSPFLRRWLGPSWPYWSTAAIITIWVASYQVSDVVRHFVGCGELSPTWVAAEGRCR